MSNRRNGYSDTAPPQGLLMQDARREHVEKVEAFQLGLYVCPESRARRLFGEQTRMFIDLTRIGREHGVDVVVLTPGYRRSRLAHRYNDQTGQWELVDCSLPAVVLRRSGAFPGCEREAQEDLQFLAQRGCLHSLPRSCGNKWTFYQRMQKSWLIRPYLPDSELASSADDVLAFLQDHGDIYAKPLNGAHGSSIYRLLLEAGHAVVRWERPITVEGVDLLRHATKTVEREFTDWTELRTFWEQEGLQRCLVQETVPLLRDQNGRPFDLRWLVQWVDEPVVVARVARIGNPDSVTTNLHTGGQAKPAEDALGPAFGRQLDWVIRELDQVALGVARTLHQQYGPFAEVGVDLAVRTDGDIALFEVNPTPGRRMLRSLPGNVRQLSLRYLIEYAIRATDIVYRLDE